MSKANNKTTVYKLSKTGKWVARQTVYNKLTGKEKNITASNEDKQTAIDQRDNSVSVLLSKGNHVDYSTAKAMNIINKKQENVAKPVENSVVKKPKTEKHWTMKLKEMKEKSDLNHKTVDEEMPELINHILPYLTDKVYQKPNDPDNILIAKALNDLYAIIRLRNWTISTITAELNNANETTKSMLDRFDVLYNMIPYNCYVSKCKDIRALGYKYTVEVSDPLTNELKLKFTTYNKKHCTAKYIAKSFGMRVINY